MSRRTTALVLLLVAACAAVAVLGLAGGGPSATSDTGDPSSRNAGRDGTLALYEWLGDLGLDAHRVSGDFDLASSDVLLVVEPSESFTTEDVHRVDAFVRGGGELVIAVSPATLPSAQPVLDDLGLGVDRAAGPGLAEPSGALDPGGRVGQVVFADEAVDVGNAGSPLLRLDDGSVVLSGFSVGAGQAFVLGSGYPLSNEGLRFTRPDADGLLQPTGSDAYGLVLALLDRARARDGEAVRIGFDEVHHGEGATGGIGAILVGPLGLALLLALLVVVAWLGTSGRRMGAPVPAHDPAAVPTAASFLDAMAELYERSAHRGGVADRYAQELKDRVGAAAGLDPHLDDAPFCARLRGHGEARADEVAAALHRARSAAAGRPTDAELLDLSRAVDAVEAGWTAGAPL